MQQPAGEQQGVAGQEEADQQPALGEDDQQQAGDPVGVDQVVGADRTGDEHVGERHAVEASGSGGRAVELPVHPRGCLS